jgi:hypothetical protein
MEQQPFDIFEELSNKTKALPSIIIFKYLSIQYLIKTYIDYYSRNILLNPDTTLSCGIIPTFNSITFKSKVNLHNSLIYSLPSELTRGHYGYYSNNIYDRILKFEYFMNHFLTEYNNMYFSGKIRHDIHVPKLQENFNLFDYIDLDSIITQYLNIHIKNEEIEDDDNMFDDEFIDKYDLNKNNYSLSINKQELTPIYTNEFKYSQVYNLDSINKIISVIVDLFQLDGYSMTDYNLKSIRLNSLIKVDYMVLFNYNYIIDICRDKMI